MYRLIAEDMGKWFGDRKLFSHLSFELGTGDSLAVVGPNGAGKSTLLMSILGLMRPSQGRPHFLAANATLSDVEKLRAVGFVAPYLQLYDQLTGEENLKFFASVSGISITGKRVNEVLHQVGLAGRGDDLVRGYSSGMKQRLKYAVATVADPQFLFLDEPMSNLDADGRQRVTHLIAGLRAKTILVLATSDEEEARLASEQCRLG